MAKRKKVRLTELAVRIRENLLLSGKRPRTVEMCFSAVRGMARYYRQSPDQLSEDHVQKHLVYLTDKKKAATSMLQPIVSSLNFF